MLNDIMTQLQPVIVSVCVTILTAVGTYVGTKIKAVYTDKVNTETKEKIVHNTCRYVNQLYDDLQGQEKFELAQKEIVEQLNQKGISITELELKVMIEAAVNGLKKGMDNTVLLKNKSTDNKTTSK